MRDNLIFFNIPETDKENTTQIIHEILENKMEMKDASTRIKIDRSHRLGKGREGADKSLYPELRKAKAAGKRANIVRDKMIIDGAVFNPSLK